MRTWSLTILSLALAAWGASLPAAERIPCASSSVERSSASSKSGSGKVSPRRGA